MFSKDKNTILEWESQEEIFKLAESITCWEYMDKLVKYSHAEIRDFVYFAEYAYCWQRFRVSLKGWNTKVKLARLQLRWEGCLNFKGKGKSRDHLEIEFKRINNYIDALKRGGFIDSNGVILK